MTQRSRRSSTDPATFWPLRPDWWRLGATATMQVAADCGWRGDDRGGGAPWIRTGWDGRSDIRLGSEMVTAEFVGLVIDKLRRSISTLGLLVAGLPDRGSVRLCIFCEPHPPTFVIDINLGEFVLPVGVTEDFLKRRPGISPANVALEMVKVASWFDANRAAFAATEQELRGVFVEQSMRACVLPLWFRMPTWHIGQDNAWRHPGMREFVVLMLDQDLRPVTSGVRLSNSPSYISYYLAFHGRHQRLRVKMRRNHDACGSSGFVTEVALGLIEARGMDPDAVLHALRTARASDDDEGIVHKTATTHEWLSLHDGVVDAMISFDGGFYSSGKLTLEGEYPEALAMAAKGRRLSDFVDHPAFRAAGIAISHGRKLRGKLRLYHAVRSIPVEEAARTRFGNRLV